MAPPTRRAEARRYAQAHLAAVALGLFLLPPRAARWWQHGRPRAAPAAAAPPRPPAYAFEDPAAGGAVLAAAALCYFPASLLATYLAAPSVRARVAPGAFVLRSLAGLVAGTAFFHAVAVLFGAPLTALAGRTLCWAALQATHAVVPAAGVGGLAGPYLHRLFVLGAPQSVFEASALWAGVGASAGAWLGAVAIPLDWDAPWQRWPLPLLYGAAAGTAVAHGVSWVRAARRRGPGVAAAFLTPSGDMG